MKKLFVHKYIKKLGSNKRPSDYQEEEDFMTYLGHYKTGQEETGNFLAFYNSKKVRIILNCFFMILTVF